MHRWLDSTDCGWPGGLATEEAMGTSEALVASLAVAGGCTREPFQQSSLCGAWGKAQMRCKFSRCVPWGVGAWYFLQVHAFRSAMPLLQSDRHLLY